MADEDRGDPGDIRALTARVTAGLDALHEGIAVVLGSLAALADCGELEERMRAVIELTEADPVIDAAADFVDRARSVAVARLAIGEPPEETWGLIAPILEDAVASSPPEEAGPIRELVRAAFDSAVRESLAEAR